MSSSLRKVIKHLEKLRRELDRLESNSDCPDIFIKRREIAEQYANADSSLMAMPAATVRRSVAVFEAIKGEWFYQSDIAETRSRLLYIHGCGGAHGRLAPRLSFAAKIAEVTGAAVLAVDYRQFPQYPYSASLADCLAAYSWILIHGPNDDKGALHTCVLGEAEGGTLALSTLQNIKRRELKSPDAAVALSPLTDWSGASESWTTLEGVDPFLSRQFLSYHRTFCLRGIDDPKDPMASPLYGDLEDLPPLLLQVGGREILLDDAKRFADKVTAAGGRVNLDVFPGMPHAFQLFSPLSDEATNALNRIAAFIHSRTRSPQTDNVVYMRPSPQKKISHSS